VVAWYWDSERGKRVRARGRLPAWAGRRDPFFLGLFVGIATVVGLVVAGASAFLVCFGGLFGATLAASLVSLLSDEPAAADLTGPNPAELNPVDGSRVETADQVSNGVEQVGDVLDGVGDAAREIFP
jgi:hypothetical protein